MHSFILFLHWLPCNIFQKILKFFKIDFWADINNLNLLSKKDIKKIVKKNLFKKVRTLGLISNKKVIRSYYNEV